VHEYWAPNLWAIYYFLDKVLAILGGFRTKSIYALNPASTPQHAILNTLKVLPDISAGVTILIILSLLVPISAGYLMSKKKVSFAQLVCMSGLVFFLFGFHVHEKAISPYIHLLFVFAPWATGLNAAVFVNIVNLIPLLIKPAEKTFSIVTCLLWLAIWEHLDMHKKDKIVEAQNKLLHHFSW